MNTFRFLLYGGLLFGMHYASYAGVWRYCINAHTEHYSEDQGYCKLDLNSKIKENNSAYLWWEIPFEFIPQDCSIVSLNFKGCVDIKEDILDKEYTFVLNTSIKNEDSFLKSENNISGQEQFLITEKPNTTDSKFINFKDYKVQFPIKKLLEQGYLTKETLSFCLQITPDLLSPKGTSGDFYLRIQSPFDDADDENINNMPYLTFESSDKQIDP